MKISVVIPVFNEEDSVKELYGQISTALKNQKNMKLSLLMMVRHINRKKL